MKYMKKLWLCVGILMLTLLMLLGCDIAPKEDEAPDEEIGESESSSTESEGEASQENLTSAEIVKAGVYQYRIVVSRSATADVKAAAERLAQKLEKRTGVATEVINDEQCSADEALILVGNTRLQASKTALETIAPNAYTIEFVGKHLVVTGHEDTTTQIAVNAFLETVLSKATVTSSDAGKNLSLKLAQAVRGEHSLNLDRLDDFDAGEYLGTYPCANGVVQKYYTNADSKGMDAYIRKMNASGYLTKEENQIGKNRYATCVGEHGMVHLTYLDYNQSFSVILDPLEEHIYKESEPEYTKLGVNNFAVMSRDYSVQADVLDGNGQSYVMTLEDGRYVIIDGGYADCGDDDALYNYMKANNRRSDGKIVIAAWIFTHSHGDHIGAFQSFSKTYASRVTVDYFVFNTGTDEMYREGQHSEYLEKSFEGVRAQYFPTAQTLKPHAGQILKFCNVEFEVLYTQENYAPNVMPWENDSSLVVRIHMDGKTFLIMGDCEATATSVLCQMYGNALMSDVVQVNHHGYSGGTNELYDLCDPTYALWTTSQAAFDLRVSGEDYIKAHNYKWISAGSIISNRYVFLKVGLKNCLVADGKIEILTVQNRAFEITYQDADFQKK